MGRTVQTLEMVDREGGARREGGCHFCVLSRAGNLGGEVFAYVCVFGLELWRAL